MPAKKKTVYLCVECGYDSPKWQGRCPACGAWDTMKEQTVAPEKSVKTKTWSGDTPAKPVPIGNISTSSELRTKIGITELDRVLGGGLVYGSLVLVSGEPGIGKSTLILQACGRIAANGDSVLYVTGEESLSQIKMRADRLSVLSDSLLIYAETQLDTILAQTENQKPSVLIIDSVQTIFNPDLQSAPGSIAQVRECTMALMQYAKQSGVSVILIGHVNKDGGIAGPKVLEHMVDAVLNFEGDRHISYRLLRAIKNRFGSTNEIGMFEMTDCGLIDVINPSAALLSGRPQNASGSCVAVAIEGTRPILAEVQGLVTKSAYGSARRTASGIDYNRAVLMLAILEKRAGFMLGAYDAYINIVGGLDLSEPAIDLAAVLAVASSYLDKPLAGDLAVFGEVGLAGEVRAVAGAAQRIAELERLGFSACILPKSCAEQVKSTAIKLLPVSDIRQAIKLGLG